MYEINGKMFANLSETQKAFVEGMSFDSMVITGSQIELVCYVLGINAGATFETMTAIRNAVVKHLSDLKKQFRENGDYDSFDRLSNNISAITCAIDSKIYA